MNKTNLVAALSGILFGLGLGISGMTQADKVINFLDLADKWDPSLAFVMGGAIAVHLIAYRLVTGMNSPVLAERFGIPTRTDIDGRLVGGAALFGVGWALGGSLGTLVVVGLLGSERSRLLEIPGELALGALLQVLFFAAVCVAHGRLAPGLLGLSIVAASGLVMRQPGAATQTAPALEPGDQWRE